MVKTAGLPAGQLPNKLVFEVMTTTRDSVGAAIQSWNRDFEVWGSFEPLGSREFPIFEKRFEQTTARFRIRYRPNIDAGQHRVIYAGKTWDIRGPIDMDGKRIQLVIEAVELT